MRESAVEFTGRDGLAVTAAVFLPQAASEEPLPGAVLLLLPFERVAARAAALVEAGFAVLAPDLLAREASAGEALPPEPPDRRALGDIDAALVQLAAEPGVDPERLAVVGCGPGGRLAFLCACHSDRPAAVVSLEGRVVRDELSARHPLQPLEMALNLSCPFLGLYAERDPGIPEGELEHARAVLSQFARSFDIVSLPGAAPGFHAEGALEHDVEVARAVWPRVTEFLRECVD